MNCGPMCGFAFRPNRGFPFRITSTHERGHDMATKPESSIKHANDDFGMALPDLSIPDADIAAIDASLASFAADLPGIGFDFAELDELLGLADLPDLPLDLPAVLPDSRDPESRKNAHTRVVGSGGEGATKLKRVCGAKTRKGAPCQAQGRGKGGRCKLHGGMSTGPKTPEGKARSLAALRSCHTRFAG
jgi:hypothetical protein